MDRIRKALDLARQDRARLLLEDEPIAPPPSTAPARAAPTFAPAAGLARKPILVPAPEIVSAREVRAVPVRAPVPDVTVPLMVAPRAVPSAEVAVTPAVEVVRAPETRTTADIGAAKVEVETETETEEAAELPASTSFSGIVQYTRTRVYTPRAGLLESNRIIDPARIDPAAAAFRMLRTQVLQRMEEKGFRSLAVLSPDAADGKTTTAVNLAVSLAYDQRHTVLLVDCDLRQPSIADVLGISPDFGLDDVLTGKAGIDQCLHHPEGFERLVILPARAPLPNSSEALSSEQARDLVAELRTRYAERIVVFDLPPILGTDDALAFLPLVDCALMVVSERATKRESLLRCMELVTKVPIIGTVLNRSTAVLRAYG